MIESFPPARASLMVTVLVATGTLAAMLTAFPSSAEPLGNNHCSANIQTPHWSNGAGGHIVKGTWQCEDVPTTIHLDHDRSGSVGLGFWLYFCNSKPKASLEWLIENCVIARNGVNHLNFSVTKANTKYTLYSPPDKYPGAHGDGWYIGAAQWQSDGPGGTGAIVDSYGPSAYLRY